MLSHESCFEGVDRVIVAQFAYDLKGVEWRFPRSNPWFDGRNTRSSAPELGERLGCVLDSAE
ncbi:MULTISPECIES: hypothetical protein [Haloferax]|jgi:hypothetical protein|uniref:Uncharacterized protein n=2 Tax=Haloferax TaxID=2251 RepID=L9VDG0_HALVD|nr:MULTISPECIES: hypothetical protein [Haloferax]ELY35260.1 hypothetical protein C498_04066 [Haloferax volcanii DS2]MBC9986470.1 hypothetical protein [Haloferax sp. AS1]RDZ32019.1 hypothetical protein C5B88_19185 [Haloferax sp. Atlit-24N]RDZ39294.1 hypothetical protein C5B89_12290 [Haloferax sp. Atlit-47N]RLM36329.1 hypothetical protein DVK03_16305 [Haloferax sp. Atlit-109R]